jgi:hypothetical protein
MDVLTRELPDGEAGRHATLAFMADLATQRAITPTVRAAAVALARETRPGARVDRTRFAAMLRRFLEARVTFLEDPATGDELVQDPVAMLEEIQAHGRALGDCDDVATLGAALALAAGLAVRFVVIYFANAEFAHVWTDVYDGDNWRDLDTTAPAQGTDRYEVTQRWTLDVGSAARPEPAIVAATGAERSERRRERQNEHRTSGGAMIYGRPLYERRDSSLRMGIAPAVIVGAVTTFAQKILPLFHSAREADRIQQNVHAEDEALRGDLDALLFLEARSGEHNPQGVYVPGIGTIGGWATPSAQQDAAARLAHVRSTAHVAGGTGTTTVRTPLGTATADNTTLLLGAAALAVWLSSRRGRRNA